METIKFYIIRVGTNACRIQAHDIRTIYREISDGSCICSMDILLTEMESIKRNVKEKYGNEVVFEI